MYLSVSEFRKELKSLGFDVPAKLIYQHISEGTIRATREILRPSRWVIPESELRRVVNLD